jgi:predicted RNA methylase
MKTIKTVEGIEVRVSDEDYERVNAITWHLHHGYPCFRINLDEVVISKFIMNPPNGLVVDHIDHDLLNNQRSNLRVVTVLVNSQNRKTNLNNKSGFRGVSFHKASGKWIAQLRQGVGKNLYLGAFFIT